MEINICIPTLNAYKELNNCIDSINNSSILVDNIYILDNGGEYTHEPQNNLHIIKSEYNLGVAGSWNWFINNVSQIRLISNDDIIFGEHAIEDMLRSYNENYLTFPAGNSKTNSFSCFILPQKIIDVVGMFDEWISPRYAYFEDNDYHRRMLLNGFDIMGIDASVNHVGSATLKRFTRAQKVVHHEKFKLAESHYIQKWGGTPGYELYNTEFGK